MFDDAHTLPCQDGLVDLQRCRENLCYSDVCRDLVTDYVVVGVCVCVM